MSTKTAFISQEQLEDQLRFCNQINDLWKSR